MPVLSELTAFGRYAWRLRDYLRRPVSPEECRRQIQERLLSREQTFVGMLRSGVFAQPHSPYRALLAAAGLTFEGVAELVRSHGIEGALERLHDAGVYVTHDEYKGRRPIERLGLSLPVGPESFDNALAGSTVVVHDVGSRGRRRSGTFDLGRIAGEAAYQSLLLENSDLFRRPYAIWLTVPPGRAGHLDVLRLAKLGKRADRWFSQTPLELTRATAKSYLLTHTTLTAVRRWGPGAPSPEHVTLAEALPVARWLAEQTSAGTPAFLVTGSSAAVRACLAAEDAGIDISGTVFRVGGEPYTSAKAAALERCGCWALPHYSSVEVSWIGVGCGEPDELDDVHLLIDKLGFIQREHEVANGAARVGALVFTTLTPNAAKIYLNVESDDYGVLSERECDCLLGRLGYRRHLHGIHSYDKLTSAGMTFVGSDVAGLLEHTLPARFGGAPTDYQFVEEEEGGLTKVSIIVSPRVGELDEAALVETVLAALSTGPAYKQMMASVWGSGETLKVVRREPHTTATAKILPLHLVRS
jgi:hypothetical protein